MLTNNEYKVLEAIVNSEYQAYGEPDVVGVPVWTVEHFEVGMDGKSYSGVCSSLMKKGYITVSNQYKKESTQSITKEGYSEYLNSKQQEYW